MIGLSNKIRAEFEGVSENDFPLHSFPQKIQSLVLDLKRNNGYPIEYTSMALLSAFSTAVGNTYKLEVNDNWKARTVFYFVIVGLPATLKTHPVNFAYAPLEEYDIKMLEKCKQDKKEFEQQINSLKKSKNSDYTIPEMPVCKRTILDDVTPEVVAKRHNDNPKGICIKVDEFISLIKSANQYSKGHFLESLLSTWSGSPLKVDRCNNPLPLMIMNPHINIIGTIQPGILSEFITETRLDSGLIDRFIFVYPQHQEFYMWQLPNPQSQNNNYRKPSERWNDIIQKFINIEYNPSNPEERILKYTNEANVKAVTWQNSMMENLSPNKSTSRKASRFSKQADYGTRFCLLFQLFRWACGESTKDEVDIQSVESAICLSEWIEKSFQRVMAEITSANMPGDLQSQKILSELPNEFETSDVKEIVKINKFMCERSVANWLDRMVREAYIESVSYSKWRKKVVA